MSSFASIAIPVASFAAACDGDTCIHQPGTNNRLDSMADRLMYRLAYRAYADGHDSLLVSHAVAVGAGTKHTPRRPVYAGTTCAISPRCPNQQGTFAPYATSPWMRSGTMDKLGNIAVGDSASSTALNPSIRYATRAPADTPGVLSNDLNVITGGGMQSGTLHRGDDDSTMTVDPPH